MSKDGPPPTPEMLQAGEILLALTKPVTQILLNNYVPHGAAGFVALESVKAVLLMAQHLCLDADDIAFALKHQSFP